MKKLLLGQIVLSLIVTLSTLTACSTPTVTPPTLSADEQTEADIYTAVVRQLYTVDHTFGSEPPNFRIIYLVEATNDRAGDPGISQTESKRLLESVQVTITAALDDLTAKVEWVEHFSEVPFNSNSTVKGNGAVITLGNIHFQEDGTALVSGGIYFANLGAGGRTYILERIDGTWQITGDTGTIWIS